MEYAGLFSDSEPLVQQLTYAGQQVGEKLWRLPLDPAYGEELHSSIADLTNTGREGSAGASSAAMFLKRFAGDQPWLIWTLPVMPWSGATLNWLRPVLPVMVYAC